jgi:hypothetical protein
MFSVQSRADKQVKSSSSSNPVYDESSNLITVAYALLEWELGDLTVFSRAPP